MNGTFTHLSLPEREPGSTMRHRIPTVVRRQVETAGMTGILQRFTQIRRDELGVWLGRRQERRAEHCSLPTRSGDEPAFAAVKAANGLLTVSQQQSL